MSLKAKLLNQKDLLWLLAAAAAGLLGTVPALSQIVLVLETAFLVKFLRTQRPLRGFFLAWPVSVISMVITSQGVIPIPGPGLLIFAIVATPIGLLPYMADRLVAPRLKGMLSTLSLPTIMTAWRAFDALTSSFGSWGSPAYTQVPNAPLLQLASAFGMSGLIFLIYWTAALLVWAYDAKFEWRQVRAGALSWAAVVVLVLAYGGLRLSAQPLAQPVPVAGIVPSSQRYLESVPPMETYQRLVSGGQLSETELAKAQTAFEGLYDEVFEATRQQAQSGAKVIFWAEGSLSTLAQNEAALIERGQQLAQAEDVYLGMAIAVYHPGEKHENKIVMIEPSGTVAYQYEKTHLVPFSESNFFLAGDGQMPVIDTPYGRIGAAICHDMDHHQFVQQASRLGVDILFIPTGDWKDIDRLHLNMAAMRAVEQGITVVRPARGGISADITPQGTVMAAVDTADARLDGTLLRPGDTAVKAVSAAVPANAQPGLYTRIGDALAVVCGLAFLALAGTATVQALKERRARKGALKAQAAHG